MIGGPNPGAFLLICAALALGLAALILVASTAPAQAQTQTPTFKIEGSYAGLPNVYEGAEVAFKLTRLGIMSAASVTVEVEIWEPNLDDGSGNNPSLRTRQFTFYRHGATTEYFSVPTYVDGVDESTETDHTLRARVVARDDGSYNLGAQDEAQYTILDPPANLPRISISSDSTSVTEGDAATFTLTRTGDTASPLAVQINIEDPEDFTRGNHWDPPPTLPTSVEFEANSSTATLSLQTLDDHRDAPNGTITVEVEPPRMRPSVQYLPGHTGLATGASTSVTDNDTAQELELNFGKEGVNGVDVNEGDNLAFVVKRRQQDADTGVPARFTVRIETDRSGDDWRLEDWTEDTGTGRLYKDFLLELTGSDLEVKEESSVPSNGESESDWDYWASIRPIEDHAGNQLTSSEEAQYWTVKTGFRETTIDATDGGASNGTITIGSDVTTVTEGEAVVYTLYRMDGPTSKPVTVRVQTTEPNRQVESTQYHNVTIEPWEAHAEFTVYSYVDDDPEPGVDQLIANILSISQVDGADRYTEGQPNTIVVEINDPSSGSAIVAVAANPDSIVEGGSTTVTFTRAGGDTTQPLTINIRVDDPDDRLRGNHWDPAPTIPTEVTIPANSTTGTLTLTFPDDQRDLEPAGLVKVHVLPGTGYYPGQSRQVGIFTTLSVSDNDTAQELTFKWGRISPDSEHWEAGESYLTCDEQDNCTPGPAEGTFYYDDDRSFAVSHALKEPHPAHFLVSRRAQDTRKTATFVVRVEHNRDWESPRHSDWPTDPETGNRYQEFPLTLTGNQRQVVGRIEVLDNGLIDDSGWQYSAEIKQIEDAADGTVLSATDEAQYWTVNGARKKTIWPDLTLGVHIKLDSVTPKEVAEGQDVTITLERNWGNPLEPHTVQVRTWEPNQRMADGTNPTDQVHDVVFPALPMTDRFVEYVTQTETLTVTTYDDSVYEPQDTFKAGLLIPSTLTDRLLLLSTKTVTILDDDRPTITLSVDDTSITEGDTATFTLTRGHNTADELIVGVSVDDPGGFLEGNYASEAVEVPSSIMFAAGETTKEVAITPPDDWRDIPDNAFTFTVAQEPHYDIVGNASFTVQVADNDVAPQVSISFNHAEVDEGNDLILQIRRIGEDKNPLEIPITAGPVGDEQYHVFGMDAGMSLLHYTYRQPDDSYRGPDHHYTATLQPGRPEFWTPASTATVTGAILDNDPYIVGVQAYRNNINEGNLLDYRLFHNGHTGEPLQVRVNHSETGNAVYDSALGNQVHTIPAGNSYITPGYITHRNDGYDGDAEFTVELLADDAYEIDSSYPSGTVIVRNTDPMPVLGFRDTGTTVSEGAGTVDVWVDMLSALPSLMTTTVDYSVNDYFTGDGLSVTQSTGTLTFDPGETSAAVPVEVLQNSIAGYKERFHIVLSNPVNAALQDGATQLFHHGVIEDDESAVTLEAQAEAVDEGSDVILTLTRDGSTTDELTVWLQVTKTAPQADDRRETVVFPAGDATVEHTITTTDDGVRDGSHTVTATLLDPPAIGEPRTYWRARPTSVTVTVRDTNLETVILLAPTLRVVEGDSITLELARSGRGPLTVTLEVTETGDYTIGTLPETVTFALQQATATVTIPTQDDSTAEDIGKLTVTLVDGTDYRAGWPNSHTFTIYDNDGAKPSVSVTRDQAWVNEGDPVSFTVTRSTPTTNALQARLELNRVRLRVTQADLDDPTLGITTPENHIHFDTEEITVDFPAGTRTVTVTRQTTDDTLNYGNSTYHATVLNDADDDYVALYNASAFIWVQDDDVPTVTGSSTTSEYYGGYHETVLPFSRTGDVSGQLWLDSTITHVTHWPAPLQDETRTRSEIKGWVFDPGDASGVSIGHLSIPEALGRSGTLELQPHYCPNNPANCGYYPQYQVGTPSSIDFRYYSNFMGVRIKRDKASVSEGDAATFTLYRHGGKPDSITRTLQVNVQVTQEGEYISGAAPQTVTFAANQATATLSVPTTDDGVDELDGAITAELLYTGVLQESCPSQDDRYCYRVKEYPGTPWYVRSVTTAVADNDYVPPDVSISDASAGETDGTIEFTVTLSQANSEQAASVDWATEEDGSTTAATGDVDFTAASGTLNFAIGETEKTLTVSLLDDQSDEADETFNVVLSNASELTLSDDTGVGTILDDDLDYGIAFTRSTFHTEEGDDVVFQLQRLVPQDPGFGVCYVTIQGECFMVATEGAAENTPITVNLDIAQTGDFLSGAPPTTVTFAQGVAVVDVTLPTVDDTTVEADGSLVVNIPQGAGYSPVYIGPPDSNNQGAPYRTLYLYDNDLEFSIADAQAGEAAGQLDFIVSLNGPAPQQVTVDVATVDGEATSHANVTPTSLGQDFQAGTETLTFAAGEQSKTFSVVTLDDTIHERNETFTAELSTPPQTLSRYNSAQRWLTLTSLADPTAVGTIDDDDQALVASVSRTYSIVNEDQVGPVRFTVELSHPDTTATERNPAVGWRTVPGTAVLGEDYQGENGRLTFMPGVNTGSIDVDIVDDNLFESYLETFSVELVASETRLVTISPTEGSFQVSIRDNETLTASIAADAETVAEGNDVTFTVTLTGGVPADDASVAFETSGTATVTDDYAAPKGAITFPPGDNSGEAGVLEISAGQSRGTITFPVLADGISDDDETLKVEIFSAATEERAGSVSSTDNVATTTILDQDNLTVSIGDAPSVTEGAVATFTITLSTTSDQDVSAGWATKQAGDALDQGETALPDKDYAAASGTVAIPAGDMSATFTVATTQDTLVEGAETFVVALEEATIGNSSPPEMVPLGVTNAEGTITDDDAAPTGLTISSISHNQVDEDAGATDITVTVALDGTTQFTVDTPVTVKMIDRPGVQNNATLGVDYTATTSNVVIPAEESSVTTTITLTPVDDSLSEDDEIARLSAKSTAFTGSAGKGVKIVDNDTEPGEVVLTVAPDAVAESASSVQLTVTGTLAGQSSRVIDTVVSLELAGDTATAGVDFQSATATLTIPAGGMSATATMTLAVLDDDIVEGDETLEITGTVPGTITARPADVVIEDDDQEPTSISLSATTGPISEGDSAVTIPVQATLLGGGTRSVDTQVALSVLDVSATVDDDYTAAWDSSTLTIPAGEYSATATLTLTPVEDTVYEGDEQVAVRGLNSDPGLPVNGVRLTITDNDPQPTTVRLSMGTDTVSEGSSPHFVTITATLEGASTLTSDVNFTVNVEGETQRSQSYLAVLTAPLQIEAGQSSGTGTLYLSGTDDDVEDEDETVTIEGRSNHPGLTVIPTQLKIANDDTSGIRVAPTSLTIREGQREHYRVALATEPTADVVVTIDVPANAGFTVNPGSLTFTPQSWGRKYVFVQATHDDDGDDEPAAEVTHSITSADTKYRDLSPAGVAVTIRDDDHPLVEVSFGNATYTVDEGETVDITLTLSVDPERPVTIPVTATDQNGASAADYSGVPVNVTFASGETEKTVTFTAIQDTDDDDGESVKLGFGTLPNRVSAGATSEATVNITDDDVPEVKVSFGAAAYTVAESDDASTTDATENQVVVAVTLDADPERQVVIPIEVTEQDGATSDDYSNVPSQVVFNSGDTEQTFTFIAAPDHVDDDGESVKLAFGATLPDGVTAGATAQAVVTIADDDTAGVTVTPTELTVTEGGQNTYTVVLDSQPEGNVTVTVNDPTDNTDVTADPPSLTFTATDWNTEQTVTVSAAQDDDDQDEAATVKHTVSGYGAVTSAADVDVSVLDDAPETVTVSFEQAAYTMAEGGTKVIKVVLDADPERTITVPLTHVGQDGAGSSDYEGVPANVVFNSGDMEKTFTITAIQDTEDDDGESVKLGFGTLPEDVAAGTPAEATVSIEDDDDPAVTVSFEQPAYSVAEGSDLTVAVTLSADPERTVAVTLTKVDQGGATSADYSNVPADVTFNAGDTRKTFTFTATQDTEDDDDESVKLGFGTPLPAGVSVGETSETTVSITDDDVPSVNVSFGQAAYTVAESDDSSTPNTTENEVSVTISLSADPERTVTIPITAINQGGATSADYSSLPENVVFNSGDTEKTFTFAAADDTDDDDGESVKLGFGTTLPPGVAAGSPAEATISITDDDVPSVTVSFEQASYTVAESDDANTTSVAENQVEVKVKLSADPERTVTIPLTKTDQGGASAADYSVPSSVVFDDGDTEQTFTFSASHDTVDDDDESVKLGFGTPLPDGVSAGSPDETVISITDDDVPNVTVSFEQTAYTVAEGGSVAVKVKLSADPERTVEVPISATDMDGASPSDYSIVPQTVVFNSGDTEKTFSFAATDDTENDDGERVRLNFGTLPPERVSSTSPSQAVVSITDDDVPSVTASFGEASYTVAEGDSVAVKVILSAQPERAVDVRVTATYLGGVGSTDFTGAPTTLSFGANDTEKTLTFSATDDTDDDDGESVRLNLADLPTGVSSTSPSQAVVSITDNDDPAVTVSFEQAAYTVSEGSIVMVKVKLSADPERTVTIPLTKTNQGGATPSDYSVPNNVMFDTGETEKTFDFEATEDSVDDDGESVKLGFGNSLPAGVTKGSTDETTISIMDDDVPSVNVSFEQDSYTVPEGGSVSVKVTLSADPERTVTIPLLRVNQDGASAADYSGIPASVVFNSGDTEQTVDFEATDDTEDDDGESVRISFGNLPDQVSAGTHSGTTISITDDDVPSVTVSFEQASYTVAESDDASTTSVTENEVAVKVVLSADPERTVTIPLTSTNQGGATSADYSNLPADVVFDSGDTEKSFTFQATPDDVDDEGESVKLGFGTPMPDGVSTGTHAAATVSITDDDTAGVSISETSLDIEEGDSDIYTVVLDTEPVGNVTVTIGGNANTDATLDKTTLTFTTGNWNTAQTVRVTAEQDADAVDEEVVNITHAVTSADDSDYNGITTGSVAVTITDDDTPSADFTLTMAPPTHGDTDVDGKVNLGDTLSYTAVATNNGNVPLENVNVKDALINTSGTDCASLPIGATCTSTVTYTIVQADVDAGSVANTATATADGVPEKTVIRQTPVDQVEDLELEKTSTADGFDGTGESIPYRYKVTNIGTVTLSGTLEIDDDKIESGNITCPAVPQGGLAPAAFLTCTGSYTTVQADVDAGKVTNLATASLGDVTSGSDSVTVNWQAPLGSQPELTVGSGEDDEDAGSFTFTVTLNPSSLQTVTVDYATGGGTATSGSDYTPASGSLTFSPGDTTRNVTVTIADDDLDESDETFNLMLSDAVNASIPIPTGAFTIRDDDTAGVTVSDTSLEIDEGDSDTYTVVLDSQPTHTVTITVNDPSNTDVTAEPADLTFTTVNWDTAQTVTVSASQDNGHDDEDGTVTHTASSTDTKYDGISVSDVLVNVTDDDDVPVTVSFGSASYTVAEGNTVTVKVKLNADPERTVEVPITVTTMDGAADADFSGVPANTVFNSGDTEKTFDFEAIQDTVDDDGERVRLTFGTLPPRVSSTSPSQAVVSITDDDVPTVTASFEQSSYTVAEGDSVSVKVILSAQPERAVDIPVNATYLGGVGSLDFLGAPTTLNFDASDTEKTLTFSATDDSLDDDGEKVRLAFVNLPTGVSEGSPDETTVSITDNDHPRVTVSFASASYTVAESDDSTTPNTTENEVSVTIRLSAEPERSVTIPITATGQDGATAADYSVPASVVFDAGDTEKEITFRASPDSVDDDGESVQLGFGSTLPTRVTEGTPAETIVSITDDDVPPVTASFEQPSYTVGEGNTVMVKVVLSADPERTVTIPLLKVNQGGASSADYSGVPPNVVFNSGDTEKTFDFEATNDTSNDDGESVRVSFGTLPDRVSAGTNSGTTISITDDDVPAVTVSFEEASYTVAEGGNVTVKAILSADPERTVTIPITSTGQGGATAADYNVSASVVFNSGDTEKTLSVSATQDTVDDDGESVKLGFGNPLPTGVTVGSTDETTISIIDDDVPSVAVSFGSTSYTVSEGSSVTVKVVLSADPERTVTIPVSTTGQGGATASDYVNVPANVVFNSGETEKTFDFEATDDAADDDGESVKLGFGASLPSRVTAGTPAETTISITDDDVPSVTVSFEQSSYTVAEGNSIAVKVILSADPERTVEVPISATDMDGASSSDYSVVPQAVVFNSGDTEKTFSFSATDDTEDDDGERVRLTFGTLPASVNSTSPSQAVVSITDDDAPSIAVSFEQDSYTVAEGANVAVKVKLSADPERTVTIPITATNEGGATAADYSVPNNVVFNSGDTEKTISFAATQDSVDDDGESVTLGFGGTLPAGVTKGSTDETTISITDDDVPSVTVSFEQSAYTVAEGNSIAVKVILSADPERTVTIPLSKTNQGGATASDYSVPASIVFNSGDTEKTFSFSATQDTEDDDGESVKLGFGSSLPTGVSTGSTDETTVSITDDDVLTVTVSFEQDSYAVAEGNSVSVKVVLSANPQRTVTIPVTAAGQGGATSSDYSVPNSVVFNDGDTEKTFTFTAEDDSDNDDGESVKLTFGTLPTGVSAGSTNETIVSITDDDVPSVSVSFEHSSYTVEEGETVAVKVILSAQPERAVDIRVTATYLDGVGSTDFTGAPTTLNFGPNDTEKTLTFSATDDSLDDDGESVRLNLANLPTGVSSASPAQAVVSITDNDDPAVQVSFEHSSYTVAEGDRITIKVVLSADPERTVTIPVTSTEQDGATSSDYSDVPTNVVFNSGDTEKTFDFEATDDAVDDDGESVKLGFGDLPTRVSAGTTNETTVSITDDDVPNVTVSFEQSAYTVAEGNSIAVKVKLSADPERTVEVPISATVMDGASSSDYSIVPQTVVFNSGDTEKTFSFSATDDMEDDDGERVRLTFGTLPTRVSSTSPSQAVVSITDDDVLAVTVSFEEASYTVPEGSSVAVKVVLSADPERTLTIPLTQTNQDGATAADYSVPNNVVFNSGDTEKTISFAATQDSVDDDGESVKLGFGGNLPAGVTEGSTDETTISITDDDVPSVNVSFEESSYTVAEGNTVRVKVTLSADPERTVTIPLLRVNQGGAGASDYAGVPADIEFTSGETEKAFDFEATQDTANDDGESVRVSFGTLPDQVSAGTHSGTTISITDDDVPPVTVSFEQASYTVGEGSTVTIKVVLSADPERTVTIPLTKTNQGGATAADYSVPGSIVFNSGDTEKTLSFQATQDSVDDDGESVKLGFGSTLPAGVTKGSTDETTISITDDDVPSGQRQLRAGFLFGRRGQHHQGPGGPLSRPRANSDHTVDSGSNQGGAGASDYSVPSSVVFNCGDIEKTFDFEATQDTADDDGESVRLGFGTSLPTGVTAGSPAETTVSITDDDQTQVTVSFVQAAYTVALSDDPGTPSTTENQVSVTRQTQCRPGTHRDHLHHRHWAGRRHRRRLQRHRSAWSSTPETPRRRLPSGLLRTMLTTMARA